MLCLICQVNSIFGGWILVVTNRSDSHPGLNNLGVRNGTVLVVVVNESGVKRPCPALTNRPNPSVFRVSCLLKINLSLSYINFDCEVNSCQ